MVKKKLTFEGKVEELIAGACKVFILNLFEILELSVKYTKIVNFDQNYAKFMVAEQPLLFF